MLGRDVLSRDCILILAVSVRHELLKPFKLGQGCPWQP
jgi:hypothetical protein